MTRIYRMYNALVFNDDTQSDTCQRAPRKYQIYLRKLAERGIIIPHVFARVGFSWHKRAHNR